MEHLLGPFRRHASRCFSSLFRHLVAHKLAVTFCYTASVNNLDLKRQKGSVGQVDDAHPGSNQFHLFPLKFYITALFYCQYIDKNERNSFID